MYELVAAGVPPPRAEAIAKLDPGVLGMTVDQSAFAGWNTDSYLRAIECPVVLEHGDRDLGSVIYPGELERATALISRCTVLRIPDTGHAAWMTRKEEWDAALQSFIHQHSS